MPFLRGWVYQPAQARAGTAGFLVLTNDRWNQSMLQIGVVPIRTSLEPFDLAYSSPLPDGTAVVASRLGASDESEPSFSLLGPAIGALAPRELAGIEDRLCDFFQLPALLATSPRIGPPLGDARAYAVWGEIHLAGAPVDGERKRRIVVSPNAWNAVSGMATLVRTTTSFGRYGAEFPEIQRGRARACCGDAATFELASIRLAQRDRPTPHTATMRDMVALARGLTVTHELDAAVVRAGARPSY